MTSQLLINEPPLQLLPSLAATIGLNEAIVLQQIQYWISGNQQRKSKHHFIDGRWWTYNTAEAWQEQFPFWSVSTVRRILASLKARGLIIAEKHGNNGFDHTLWYTIDYVALNELPIMSKSDCPSNDSTDLTNLDNSTYTETSITENSTEREQAPPVSQGDTPASYTAFESQITPLEPSVADMVAALRKVTMSNNQGKLAETARELLSEPIQATPQEVESLFSGIGCYWYTDGAGSWKDGGLPYLGNILADFPRARAWAQTPAAAASSAASDAERYHAEFIAPLAAMNGHGREHLMTAPEIVRKAVHMAIGKREVTSAKYITPELLAANMRMVAMQQAS